MEWIRVRLRSMTNSNNVRFNENLESREIGVELAHNNNTYSRNEVRIVLCVRLLSLLYSYWGVESPTVKGSETFQHALKRLVKVRCRTEMLTILTLLPRFVFIG